MSNMYHNLFRVSIRLSIDKALEMLFNRSMFGFLPKRFYRILSIILILAILGLTSSPLLLKANAGTLTSAKVTISDSRAGLASVTYDFAFTASASTSIKQWDVQFCTTASETCTTPTGIVTTGATRSSDNVSGTTRTDTFTANGTLTTVVTTPATQSPLAITASYTGITNPTTTNTTYFARITTYSDTGTTVIDGTNAVAFAILTTTSIAVTASVDPTLTFTVAAVTSGGTVNGATTNVTSTANTIPLGTLSTGSTKITAHDVSVTTNATSGYTVTVKALADPPLSEQTATAENIDKFTGTNAAPATWSSPAGTAKSVNSGLFGYTTNDTTLTGTADRFTSAGGNKWAGPTTSALEVAYSTVGVASAETTRLGWQAEVNGLQPPGSYTGTVVLVATPTY